LKTSVARFEATVERLADEKKIPGLSVAVLKDQKVVLARGFGFADLDRQVAATADTPYDIASVTKPLSAVVAMKLVEMRLLDLDRPIAGYSQWAAFRADFSEATSIFAKGLRCDPPMHTLRHLLSHTAIGIPGERFSYNPVIYSWASRPMKSAAGESFSSLTERLVFKPAGMTRSARRHRDLPLREDLARDLALRYRIDESGRVRPGEPASAQGDGAAGGVFSTVYDLAKFDIALENGTLVLPSSYATMMTPTLNNKGESLPYGIGWYLQDHAGEKLAWHSGWWENAASAIYLKVPGKGLTLIMLANSEGLWWRNALDKAEIEKSDFVAAFLKEFL